MKLHPLPDLIFIKRDSIENVSETGILIVQEKESFSNQGIVLATGSNIKEVKEGDRVIFKTYNPDFIILDEQEYSVAKENDILAIIYE
jgi:chaperonin GroES